MTKRLTLFLFTCLVVCLSVATVTARELDDLPLDQVQFKAAHNSIDCGISLTSQLDSDKEHPYQGGCRGVELDIVADPARLAAGDMWRFAVQHGGNYDEGNPSLRACLAEIRAWSQAHPDHHVVLVHIDLKNGACRGDAPVFCEKIDEILAAGVGRENIFTPAELKRDAESLLEGARRYGWPTLGQLRGKFLFCFSGTESDPPVGLHKRTYCSTDPDQRLAFVDLDMRFPYSDGQDGGYIENPYYQQGERVFINLERGRPGWLLLGKRAHQQGGFITRVWKLNTEESWRDGIRADINVLSTDKVRDHSWATVGPDLFRAISPRR